MIDWKELLDLRCTRQLLGLRQRELADMLGVSARTVQSCEQGWRNPSAALEKSVLLLRMAVGDGGLRGSRQCWEAVGCADAARDACLVYHTRQGRLCWLLGGNSCRGAKVRSWEDKKMVCGSCDFFAELIGANGDCKGKGKGNGKDGAGSP